MAEKTDATVRALPSLCGCAGKTSLRTVVYPARRLMTARFAGANVTLGDPPDAALLPRTEALTRSVTQFPLGETSSREDPGEDRWTLGCTFADATVGGDADRFATAVGDAYAALSGPARVVVGKAHSIQLPGASSGRQWFEQLRPTGKRVPGYRVANVDAIHAFPGLAPDRQAAIAVRHAANDCYAVGATDSRTVRPFVAVPTEADVSAARADRWYRAGVPSATRVLEPSVVRHDGDGWIFGATVTAEIPHRPPVRVGALEPNDAVLLHRPVGGLTLYSHAADETSETDSEVRRRARTALETDHADVARAVASFCPAADESFDPDRHVKLATDVSGDGVLGLARLLRTGTTRLHVTELPLLAPPAVDRARARWAVPDVTVETNGPLALVARSHVADALAERLADVDCASPARLGELRQAGSKLLTADRDVAIGRYVERLAREEFA